MMVVDRSSPMRPTGRTWFRLLALAALALALPVHSARAGLVTFAQFTEKDPAHRFQFTGSANGPATFRTADGGAPVTFTFSSSVLPNLPPDLVGAQDAHLVLDLTTTEPASSSTMLGQLWDVQPFPNAGTLKILRDAPASEGSGDRRTLLEITFTGNLFGVDGGGSGNLFGEGDPRLGTVVFSSDFLRFGATTLQSLSLSLNSLFLTLPAGPNYLGDFQADATGSFGADGPLSVVPEPSTLITGGLGAVALALIVRRQRRRQRAAA